MAPGECRDSLALEVAASCRLPEAILQRASEHYQVRPMPILMLLSPCLPWCSSRLAGARLHMGCIRALPGSLLCLVAAYLAWLGQCTAQQAIDPGRCRSSSSLLTNLSGLPCDLLTDLQSPHMAWLATLVCETSADLSTFSPI